MIALRTIEVTTIQKTPQLKPRLNVSDVSFAFR